MRVIAVIVAVLVAGCASRAAGIAGPLKVYGSNKPPADVSDCLREAWSARPGNGVISVNPYRGGWNVKADIPHATMLDALITPKGGGSEITLYGYAMAEMQGRRETEACF